MTDGQILDHDKVTVMEEKLAEIGGRLSGVEEQSGKDSQTIHDLRNDGKLILIFIGVIYPIFIQIATFLLTHANVINHLFKTTKLK